MRLKEQYESTVLLVTYSFNALFQIAIISLKHCDYFTTGQRINHNCNIMRLIKLVINRITQFTIVISN